MFSVVFTRYNYPIRKLISSESAFFSFQPRASGILTRMKNNEKVAMNEKLPLSFGVSMGDIKFLTQSHQKNLRKVATRLKNAQPEQLKIGN